MSITRKEARSIVREYTSSYAKYVATSRAIPSLVDGLKPVHRRCINSADDLKIYHNKKFLKVAKLEGQVMGDYHPHGGASMTALAQPFKTRYPLFEGQGNFGCPDLPNSVAASRYIETRLTKFCEDFYLSSSDYADREDNYDGRLKEVVQYYPPIPGCLLTGASGIAVGLSTNIPTHTISDVCKSLLQYIKSPDGDSYLNDIIPETCEDSIIMTSKDDIKKIYNTGEGSILYKAKTHYEHIDDKHALVIDSFPPDYNKKRLKISHILDAVESGDLELRNESSTGIRYVFLSKDRNILEAVESRLTSSTGYRFYIEHKGIIKCYKLREIYDDFLAAKRAYVIRKYTDMVSKNEYELEYIRVLLALKGDKEYIKTLFDKSPKEVTIDMVTRYSTSADIVGKIIGSSLTSLMKDNAEKLVSKSKEYEEQVVLYKSYISDPDSKIKEDIETLYKEYKKEARKATHVSSIVDTFKITYGKDKQLLVVQKDYMYIVGTPTNDISSMCGESLRTITTEISIIVTGDYKYYVLYDEGGYVAVTKDVLLDKGSKLNSDRLVGIVGTDDLTKVTVRLSSGHDRKLSDSALRIRKGYISVPGSIVSVG